MLNLDDLEAAISKAKEEWIVDGEDDLRHPVRVSVLDDAGLLIAECRELRIANERYRKALEACAGQVLIQGRDIAREALGG